MSTSVHIKRLSTGVPGLNEVLGGGLPEFSFNLIAGPPGSGKTTLAHQMMFALATAERPALYFTVLGKPPLKMLRYQQQFKFFQTHAINRSVRYINLSMDTLAGDLGEVLRRIVCEVETYSPGLVFVDSFRSVVLDGLAWMGQSVQRNSMVRQMQIMKMRGQPSLPGLPTFRINQAGLEVFAPVQNVVKPKAAQPASRARLGTGIAGLDEMLGGGLAQGYSLLVAGPSGSGKTILAASFLTSGAQQGEKGVIAVFEQRPNRLQSPELLKLIESGRVGVVDSHASDLSIDEIAHRLLGEIERLGATRVMAVVKVRASAHSDELRLYEINDEGIVVGNPLRRHKGLLGGRPSLKSLPK